MNYDNLIENNITPDNQPTNNKTISIIALIIMFLVILFLFVFLPFAKVQNAKKYISNNENEKAIKELYGIVPLFGVDDVKKTAEDNIAKEIAVIIQKENPRFSSDIFNIDSINVISSDLSSDNEEISFNVDYVNDNCSVNVTCEADKYFDSDEWKLKDYDIVSVEYNVSRECNRDIADEVVLKKYKNATFKEEQNNLQQLYHNYIYTNKEISKTNPLYYDISDLIAVCTYNISEDKWIVTDINEVFVNSEIIPLKEFVTSSITISLPEAWIMRVYESVYKYDIDGTENINVYKNYHWFINQEDANRYSEKDGGADIFNIYVSSSNDTQRFVPDSNYFSNIKQVNHQSFGSGYIYYYADYPTGTIQFNPTIQGRLSSVSFISSVIDTDELMSLVNSAYLKESVYNVEVMVDSLNIRKFPSTYSNDNIVGTVSKGRRFTATLAQDDYEGYRWFEIGTDQWIADLNEQYLNVTYN